MLNYKEVTLKKNSILFISDQYPNDKFYIIKNGKVLFESYFADNFQHENKKGDIIGIISAVLNEPYFSTAKVIEDVEAFEIDVKEIEKIDNSVILNKIYKHLIDIMEIWAKKYYYFLSKYAKIDTSSKVNIEELAKAYKDAGFDDAVLKICENNKHIEKSIGKIKKIEEPKEISKGVFNYKKGSCIFAETSLSEHIYIIKSGAVGVYSYFNGRIITRVIYSENDIFGYKDIFGKKLVSTTVMAIEDSIIKVVDKKEFESMIHIDKSIRVYLIKMMSARTYNTILRIKAINTSNIILKIFTVIEGLVKLELLFKRTNYISLIYTIDDILSMVFINDSDYVEREIKKIKSINITNEKNIIIGNVKNFFKEYDRYKKRNSDKIEKDLF
ncbi:cyclic nucleotide-binding domain-containing protein [uncultured Brachyspira sp.]|uniref:cyclic nucleotide-binding domain-containing protein n=1 Tax=uncultured Brachyspira sp. TaxID=221953 RepID=UPI0026126B87|nr:cyclic nucleotide-binding domain-containing protein [uncultured Brachyspira sp.]